MAAAQRRPQVDVHEAGPLLQPRGDKHQARPPLLYCALHVVPGAAGLCRVAGVRNRKGPSVLHSSCDWTLCPRAFHGSPAGAQSDSSHGLCTAHRHPTKAHLVKLVPRQRPQLVQALKQDPDAVGQPRSNLHSSKPPCPYRLNMIDSSFCVHSGLCMGCCAEGGVCLSDWVVH